MGRGGGLADRAAVRRGPVPARRFGARAAVVLAVLAGVFGMHGLSVGHAPMTQGSMTMDASVVVGHPTAEAQPVPVLPDPADTVGVALVSVVSGQPGTGGAEHTGHTGMTSTSCVAVLAAAVVLALLVTRRVSARRRAASCRPASSRGVAQRVTPQVVVPPRALSLFELCVLRV